MSEELKKLLETPSKIYLKLKPKWDKARIIFKGEDSVHEAGELLLSRLNRQDDDMYKAYKNRTRFLNMFKRTIKGLNGTVKRKPYDINIDPIEDFMNNIDLAGTTLQEYSDKILHENIKIGVCGTLVDYNKQTEEEVTKAEAEKLKLRPKLSFYFSDNILKIEKADFNGIFKESLIVLLESYKKNENEFTKKDLVQYRVLRLTDNETYEQQIYKIDEEGNVDVQDSFQPEMNGKKFDYIPFFLHGEFVEPPLYDLVTTNIKHYQLKADHNHVLHFLGCPTPIRTGIDPNDDSLPTTIGSEEVWDLENKDAKVFYLQLGSEGAKTIVEELETIKKDAAFLGAELIAPNDIKETATKSNYRNASETSSLVDIVFNLSETFTKALKLFAEWAETENKDVYYNYNIDYDISKLSAQEIVARVQSWQMGAFSKKSLFKQLKKGEVALESDNYEDEQDLITKGE